MIRIVSQLLHRNKQRHSLIKYGNGLNAFRKQKSWYRKCCFELGEGAGFAAPFKFGKLLITQQIRTSLTQLI